MHEYLPVLELIHFILTVAVAHAQILVIQLVHLVLAIFAVAHARIPLLQLVHLILAVFAVAHARNLFFSWSISSSRFLLLCMREYLCLS
jgi:hypothetical protein